MLKFIEWACEYNLGPSVSDDGPASQDQGLLHSPR